MHYRLLHPAVSVIYINGILNSFPTNKLNIKVMNDIGWETTLNYFAYFFRFAMPDTIIDFWEKHNIPNGADILMVSILLENYLSKTTIIVLWFSLSMNIVPSVDSVLLANF